MSHGLPLGMNVLWFGCDVGTLCTTTVVGEAVFAGGESTTDKCEVECNFVTQWLCTSALLTMPGP